MSRHKGFKIAVAPLLPGRRGPGAGGKYNKSIMVPGVNGPLGFHHLRTNIFRILLA